MNLTVGEIIAAREALAELSSMAMPSKAAFRVSRVRTAIEKEWSLAEKAKVDTYYKYGKEDDGKVIVPPEKLEAFRAELNDLYRASVEVNAPMIQLTDIEDLDITPDLASRLFVLIDGVDD